MSNPRTLLRDYALRNGFSTPIYDTKKTAGQWTCFLTVNDDEVCAQGKEKLDAETEAARLMWDYLNNGNSNIKIKISNDEKIQEIPCSPSSPSCRSSPCLTDLVNLCNDDDDEEDDEVTAPPCILPGLFSTESRKDPETEELKQLVHYFVDKFFDYLSRHQ